MVVPVLSIVFMSSIYAFIQRDRARDGDSDTIVGDGFLFGIGIVLFAKYLHGKFSATLIPDLFPSIEQ